MAESEADAAWLIVDDEALVAMLVQDALEEIGLRTVGPAARVAEALQLLEDSPPQGALLDVNLAGEKVYPLADALAQRNIPFIFLTGLGQADLPTRYRGRPTLKKPFTPGDVQAAVTALAANRHRQAVGD